MGIIPSRNMDEQRREKNGITYFDRGTITGKDGRKYDRYAIQTHFVQVGESQTELVEKYVRPLFQEGDVLSFGAKVMCMCVKSVRSRAEVKPGFWAKHLWKFAGINHTGVGMHEPYKLQLVIDLVGLPRVLTAAAASAVTKPFGVHGVFYKVCGKGVGGIDGFYFRSSFDLYH
ncbi:MAG: F420-0--gamma-glutamyl ligase, partial [Clostridia bacterium]